MLAGHPRPSAGSGAGNATTRPRQCQRHADHRRRRAPAAGEPEREMAAVGHCEVGTAARAATTRGEREQASASAPAASPYQAPGRGRAADEAVAGAEQLQHADFLAPRLDVQAHGVAHHQQRAEPSSRPSTPDHARRRNAASRPGACAIARRAAPGRLRAKRGQRFGERGFVAAASPPTRSAAGCRRARRRRAEPAAVAQFAQGLRPASSPPPRRRRRARQGGGERLRAVEAEFGLEEHGDRATAATRRRSGRCCRARPTAQRQRQRDRHHADGEQSVAHGRRTTLPRLETKLTGGPATRPGRE